MCRFLSFPPRFPCKQTVVFSAVQMGLACFLSLFLSVMLVVLLACVEIEKMDEIDLFFFFFLFFFVFSIELVCENGFCVLILWVGWRTVWLCIAIVKWNFCLIPRHGTEFQAFNWSFIPFLQFLGFYIKRLLIKTTLDMWVSLIDIMGFFVCYCFYQVRRLFFVWCGWVGVGGRMVGVLWVACLTPRFIPRSVFLLSIWVQMFSISCFFSVLMYRFIKLVSMLSLIIYVLCCRLGQSIGECFAFEIHDGSHLKQ